MKSREKEIEDFLKGRIKKEKSRVIKVTTTRYYEIRKGYTSQTISELSEEWFKEYGNSSHAFRDGSLAFEIFNDDAVEIKGEK